MPQGIYLDATILTPEEMANTMNDVIKNTSKYYEYFKWHDHYSFHFSGENRFSAEVCRLCTFLNNETLMNQTSVYDNMSEWWYEEWPTWPTATPVSIITEPVYELLDLFNLLDPEDEPFGIVS